MLRPPAVRHRIEVIWAVVLFHRANAPRVMVAGAGGIGGTDLIIHDDDLAAGQGYSEY